MPRICFKCGRIIHDQKECNLVESRGDQFGTWLKAPVDRYRGYKIAGNFSGYSAS